MPATDNTEISFKANILGIYGQNGSGKTAVVDTLYFLQQIMIGTELDFQITDYIDSESDRAEINAEFLISDTDAFYEVGYHVLFNALKDFSDDEKTEMSDDFADKYDGHIDDFIEFISAPDVAVQGTYKDTWKFIGKDRHSLERHSNMHLIFDK